MAIKLFGLLILAVFASKKIAENDPEYEKKIGSIEDSVVVKIEEDEYAKENKNSKYVGVYYYKNSTKWCTQRWSKHENKKVSNGFYDDEEIAAHASDTLARKLMENGKQKLKLNFPYDQTEVNPAQKSSKYIGVSYNETRSKWRAQRRSKHESKIVSNGSYDDEETAARASDTLARNLMENGEQNHKLNFPDDHTEVYPVQKNTISKFIGVSYHKNYSKWLAQRWSKHENKVVFNGYYDNEKTAARASDILARKLMKNGEQKLKLNFPDDHTENIQKNKRKRPTELGLGNPQIN